MTTLLICPAGKTGSITLPNSLTNIYSSAFENCSNLESINVNSENNNYTSIDGLLYSKDIKTLVICPAGKTGLLSFPESMTSIRYDAFYGCCKLKEIIIPNTVKSFSPRFNGCTSLQKIYLPDNISLTDETVLAYSTHILPSLKEINVGKLEKDLCYYFKKVKIWSDDYNLASVRNVYIPKGLKIIIRNQKEFVDYTFMNTANADIDIELCVPVEKIGTDAFKNSGVNGLTIAETIPAIKVSDFGNLPNLKYFSAKNAEQIEAGVFAASTKLEKLELMFPGAGTKDAVSNFGELFGTTNRTGTRAVTQFFENGTSKTYYIPTTLKELVLTEGCEMIPYGGLYNCNMLESVTLPTSLYMVGEKAFFGCAKIGDIYCKGADPAVAYDNTFDGMRVSSCKLHIPYNTAELYKRSTGWKNFYYFEEEAPLRISVTKTIENAGVIYGLNEYQPGQTAELKAVANSGYVFKGWLENEQPLTDNATYSFLVTDSRDLTAWFVPVLGDNSVEINAESDGATFAYMPVDGAVSYSLDVYSDESMTVRVGNTTEEVQNAKALATPTVRVIGIRGLDADSQYYYKITALAANGIILSQFTGAFKTKSATGIDDISAFTKPTVTARYDSTGRKTSLPVKGLNIIRYSDGTIRKVMVK